MKIAIVMSGNEVSQHFGQSEKVMIAEIEAGEIKSREIVNAPDHNCSALPNLFVKEGVSSVIAGGMGAGAIQNLTNAGVQVYAGVQGPVEDALGNFLAGTLVTGQATCGGGGHGDGCAH